MCKDTSQMRQHYQQVLEELCEGRVVLQRSNHRLPFAVDVWTKILSPVQALYRYIPGSQFSLWSGWPGSQAVVVHNSWHHSGSAPWLENIALGAILGIVYFWPVYQE